MTDNSISSEISAIQIKLQYLHYKSLKINEEISRIRSIEFQNPASPEAIKTKGEFSFCAIDIISLFEGYNSFASNVLNDKFISRKLKPNLKLQIEEIKDLTNKWKHVRNKIGGHLDIKVIKSFCDRYNYKGVFITDYLEADFKGVILLQMIESAINNTLGKSHLFENEINLISFEGLEIFLSKINEDWKKCFQLYYALFTFLYEIGKEEKMNQIGRNAGGIIKF